MDTEFYKSPWFIIIAAITLWSCGYVTADDNRIERENRDGYHTKIQQDSLALPAWAHCKLESARADSL